MLLSYDSYAMLGGSTATTSLVPDMLERVKPPRVWHGARARPLCEILARLGHLLLLRRLHVTWVLVELLRFLFTSRLFLLLGLRRLLTLPALQKLSHLALSVSTCVQSNRPAPWGSGKPALRRYPQPHPCLGHLPHHRRYPKGP